MQETKRAAEIFGWDRKGEGRERQSWEKSESPKVTIASKLPTTRILHS